MTTTTTAPSITGRPLDHALHQIKEGDLLWWNDTWVTVQTIHRRPDALNPVNQVQGTGYAHADLNAHGNRTGHMNFSGAEQTAVQVVPRSWVRPWTVASAPASAWNSVQDAIDAAAVTALDLNARWAQ